MTHCFDLCTVLMTSFANSPLKHTFQLKLFVVFPISNHHPIVKCSQTSIDSPLSFKHNCWNHRIWRSLSQIIFSNNFWWHCKSWRGKSQRVNREQEAKPEKVRRQTRFHMLLATRNFFNKWAKTACSTNKRVAFLALFPFVVRVHWHSCSLPPLLFAFNVKKSVSLLFISSIASFLSRLWRCCNKKLCSHRVLIERERLVLVFPGAGERGRRQKKTQEWNVKITNTNRLRRRSAALMNKISIFR